MTFKISWTYLLLLLYLLPIQGQIPTWYISYQGSQYDRFWTMNFIDEQNGWIAGRIFDSTPPFAIKSLVLKTTDGGNTWIEQQFDSLTNSAVVIEDINFLDTLTGILTSTLKIYFTQDGGNSWTKNEFPNDSLVYYTSHLFNDSTWIVGGGETRGSFPPGGGGFSVNVIKKTTDFGATWSHVFLDTLSPVSSMDFLNDSCGVAIAGNRILYTNNYGDSWNYINYSPNLIYFIKIQSINNNVFALATERDSYIDILLKSLDNGHTWYTIYTFNTEGSIHCMHFANSLYGRAGGMTNGNNILLTTDGGFNWIEESLPVNMTVHSIFSTQNTGFAGAYDGGIILKYGIPSLIHQKDRLSKTTQTVEIFPNPGNEQFTISIFSNLQSIINVEIYDILGNKINHLIKNKKIISKFNAIWNSKNNENQQVASGIYFTVIKTDKKVLTKKILLLR